MFKNLVLVIATTLICVVTAEFAFRLTLIGSYSHNKGLLFYSTPSFVSVGDNAVRYQPDTAIRSVAVYGKLIDYDVTNQTNNLGFYDNIPYSSADTGQRNIVFLGDSFTSSSGGDRPWVTTLRENINRHDVQLYNLGVSGTGIEAFYNLLKEFKEKIPIDEANFMAITSDFFRTTWYPEDRPNGIWLCRGDTTVDACVKKDPSMYKLSANDTQKDILTKASEIYKEKNADRDQNISFIQSLRLFNLYCDAAYSITKSTESIPQNCPQLGLYYERYFSNKKPLVRSLEILGKLKTEFPEIRFRLFHLPEKSEVNSNKYVIRLDRYVRETGVEHISLLTECEWSLSMFHKHDGHPNNNGYANIAKCMANYVD